VAGKRNSPGCGCCDTCPCEQVNTAKCVDVSAYTFSMSGVSNSDCTECSVFNGDFTLCKVPTADQWDTPAYAGTPCGHTTGNPLYRLSVGGGYYTLSALGTGTAWRKSSASWVCAGTNVLTASATSPDCSGFPATVTLTPCATCGICDPTASMPASVQIDISGVTNRACDCDNLNGTFVLDKVSGSCLRWYENRTLLGCPWNTACDQRWVGIRVEVGSSFAGYYWVLRIHLGAPSIYCLNVEQHFVYMSAVTFDCSVPRTMTLTRDADNWFCDGWGAASVTLTPL
jgi:hypothetical protein